MAITGLFLVTDGKYKNLIGVNLVNKHITGGRPRNYLP